MLLNSQWFSVICGVNRYLRSATMQAELTEFPVINTGYNKRFFHAAFPFSWIVKHQIDVLLFDKNLSGNNSNEYFLIMLSIHLYVHKEVVKIRKLKIHYSVI